MSKLAILDAVYALALVLGGAIILVLGHSMWLRQYRKLSDRFLLPAHKTLARAIDGLDPIKSDDSSPSHEMQSLHHLPAHLLVKLFADVDRTLSGQNRKWLTVIGQEAGLDKLAEHYCKSRLWWRRLEGARLLTLMRAASRSSSNSYRIPTRGCAPKPLNGPQATRPRQ